MDHYAVFGLGPSSTQEEIKKRYQELLLRFHPDKQNREKSREATSVNCTTSSLETDSSLSFGSKFHLLETSWKVLRDPDARRQFDAARNQRDKIQSHPIGERVLLSEMTEEDGEEEEEETGQPAITTWSHPCRCGGEYLLYSDDESCVELLKGEAGLAVTVCCSDCSLAISVSNGGVT